MMSLRMDCSSSLNQESKHGIMDDFKDDYEEDGVLISSSSDVSSLISSDSEFFGEEMEESSSPSSSSPSSGSSSSSSKEPNGALENMSCLLGELPFKKGLSKHYNGKSQSFTSLANVNCLEDLAKPENPYNKRLKSCKSYGLLDSYRSSQPHRSASSSRLISKKTSSSRGTCSSLRRNGSFLGNRPPIHPPHRSTSTTSFANQTPLFA